MEMADVSVFPLVPSPIDFISETRLHAPAFLQILIEQIGGIEGVRSLRELSSGDVLPLSGGKMSILYAVRANGRWVVVKFRSGGGAAEAAALKAWKQAGAGVVDVLSSGVIPSGKGGYPSVDYLVLEAAVDGNNGIARTAQAFIGDHPAEAEELARGLGEMLAKMHRAVSASHLGDLKDGQHMSDRPPQDWTSFLVNYLDTHITDLLVIGFSHGIIERVKWRISQMSFPSSASILHGDYSARNCALTATKPYQIKVFDPNPLIGHPSWDLAILANNALFARRRVERNQGQADLGQKLDIEEATWEGVRQGYRAAGGAECSDEAIAAAQLMRCLYLLPQKVYSVGKEVTNSLESCVLRDTLAERIDYLANS